MSFNAYPVRGQEPEVVEYLIRIEGAGTSAPEKEVGAGVTVSRTGTGAYSVVWGQEPGRFIGFGWALGASTPADVAGHTVVRDDYDASTRTLPIVLYNASFAAHDLAAAEYIDLTIRFSRTAVRGA